MTKAATINGVWLGMSYEKALAECRKQIETLEAFMASGQCFGLDAVYAQKNYKAALKLVVAILAKMDTA